MKQKQTRADSITWNPHKLMGALLQSSAFLVKHEVPLVHIGIYELKQVQNNSK